MPVCGYATRDADAPPPELVDALKDKPIWVFHAADDAIVLAKNSDVVVEALRAAGSSVRYTRYDEGLAPSCVREGDAHASWELAFAERELWAWVAQQALSPL